MRAKWLITIVLLFCSSTGFAQQQTVPFNGTVTKSGSNYSLSADGAQLEAPKSALVTKDGTTSIKVGSRLKVLKTGERGGVHPDDRRCPPPGKTYCAGLVEGCCGSGKVLGACIGAWGC